MACVQVHGSDVREKVAIAYTIHGDAKRAAEEIGIPRTTVNNWVNNDSEFQARLVVLSQQRMVNVRAMLEDGMKKSLEAVHKRLAEGDEVLTFDKESGKHIIGNKAVSAKDAAVVFGILTSNGMAMQRGAQESVEDSRVDKLLSRLERLAGADAFDDKVVAVQDAAHMDKS
jgi:hypothetical protein